MKLQISLRNRKQLRIARYSTLSLIIITDLNLLQIFFQIKEIDFDKLFFPVVCYETACLFLAIATLKDWDIHNVDIKTVYFYGNLDEKIYMEQSEGFRLSSKEKKVQQLYKVLYGLKQAGLSWWQTMTKSMLALGFKQCKFNAGVYYFIDEETRELVIAIIYVDDICFMGSHFSQS